MDKLDSVLSRRDDKVRALMMAPSGLYDQATYRRSGLLPDGSDSDSDVETPLAATITAATASFAAARLVTTALRIAGSTVQVSDPAYVATRVWELLWQPLAKDTDEVVLDVVSFEVGRVQSHGAGVRVDVTAWVVLGRWSAGFLIAAVAASFASDSAHGVAGVRLLIPGEQEGGLTFFARQHGEMRGLPAGANVLATLQAAGAAVQLAQPRPARGRWLVAEAKKKSATKVLTFTPDAPDETQRKRPRS